ncbi:general substrate transporter [Dacryopinax primogenitus]|uniref:General substrate transporter n=1 Tax=Dacryopinax primogenitus (strain DJM 731) TaxID=1858805 RepID=M5G7K1_DACPD|nr:general substrate transporter [Dacryopinax primogenitus]EJU01857.1 general substrate transporter [Dacryopinax primogenitus]
MAGGYVVNTVVAGLPQGTVLENLKCFIICLLVSIATFQYGFDTAMQGFLKVFGVPNATGTSYVIQTTFQQLITSLLQLGLIIASAIMGPFSKYLGRKMGFIVASVLAIIAITIQELVTTQGPIYFARLLLGIANGMYVNLVVLYVSEASPSHLRGAFVAAYQAFNSGGGLIGSIINNAFKNDLSRHSYQFQLIILYVVPVWLIIYSVYLPESPRWLATQGRDEDAHKALTRLRGNALTSEQINIELESIKEAIRIEKETETGASFFDIFRGTDLRRTILCCAATTLHASSGINFLVGYGTVFFQVAGQSNAFVDTIILQMCGLIGALMAPFVARVLGRKKILIFGFCVTTATMFIVAILSTLSIRTQPDAGKALVAMVCIYEWAYAISVGPLAWVVAGEIPSNRLRSMTFGFGMAIGFVFAWLTTFTTPYFINATALNLGGKVAWIWGPSNLLSVIFLIFFLPETQGFSLEELDELFINKVPARKFSTYKIHGIDAAALDGTHRDGLEP